MDGFKSYYTPKDLEKVTGRSGIKRVFYKCCVIKSNNFWEV